MDSGGKWVNKTAHVVIVLFDKKKSHKWGERKFQICVNPTPVPDRMNNPVHDSRPKVDYSRDPLEVSLYKNAFTHGSSRSHVECP